MKKKVFGIISVLLVILLFVCGLTGFFTKGVISKHIYFPQNVFEEIWNMLASEEFGGETLLTTGTEDAYVDFDFGIDFVGVYIPACDTSLHWSGVDDGGMKIYLHDGEETYQFIYVYDTKMLYGDADEAYLIEQFLTCYFQWFEVTSHLSSKFSLENLGEYTYQFADPVYSYKYAA